MQYKNKSSQISIFFFINKNKNRDLFILSFSLLNFYFKIYKAHKRKKERIQKSVQKQNRIQFRPRNHIHVLNIGFRPPRLEN